MTTQPDAHNGPPVNHGRRSSVAAAEAGRLRRATTPRRALGTPPTGGRDPLGILAEQNATRLQELLPLRRERMSQSRFTFYRGTAAIMAADLAAAPHSGILLAACGDAHLNNFGFYASPQRTLLFDLNDFDEAAWAPWEWDLKRLVTSVLLAGEETGRSTAATEAAAKACVEAYLRATRGAARLDPISRYYTHFDPSVAAGKGSRASRRPIRDAIRAATRRTGERAARRLTEETGAGVLRFIENPPVMTHLPDEAEDLVRWAYATYLASANVDVRLLLNSYAMTDVARRAVGVGSVGTRCFVFLLRDGDGNSTILQTKQAGRSVLEQYGGIVQPAAVVNAVREQGEGSRVVGLQRVLQAYSDPFLGHLSGEPGDYYVRQFNDMKGGIEHETLDDSAYTRLVEACAVVLARAHSQSGLSAEILGYVGNGGRLTTAILGWCRAYCSTVAADYEAFLAQGE